MADPSRLMKQEVWLKRNWRVTLVAGLVPALLIVICLGILFGGTGPMVSYVAMAGAAMGFLLLIAMIWRATRPRLAYRGGALAVYLSGRRPWLVPIDHVECFFPGQGPSLLPVVRSPESQLALDTATLIVRIAESAHDWKHRDVRPWLGQWCEGYIIIRGTCCEPLNADLVSRLNRRLVEVHREQRKRREEQQV